MWDDCYLSPGTGVTTYALHPGGIATDLASGAFQNAILQNVFNIGLHYLSWPILKDVEHGAQTSICAAVDPALSNESGKYYW